jgi:hypothetical protein
MISFFRSLIHYPHCKRWWKNKQIAVSESAKENEMDNAIQHEHGHHNKVAILIDKKHYESPDPTTGDALYLLGGIPTDYDLWLEVHGQGDDKLIPRNDIKIDLKPGDQFYSAQRSLNPGAHIQ